MTQPQRALTAYQRATQQAEMIKARRRAEAIRRGYWWRKPALWQYAPPYHSSVEAETFWLLFQQSLLDDRGAYDQTNTQTREQPRPARPPERHRRAAARRGAG